MLRPLLPADAAEWSFASAIVDYDARVALTHMRLPLLAVFGGDDPVVPVEASVDGLHETVPAHLLRVEVFAGADHRMQVNGSFADGYLSALAAFVDTTTTSGQHP